MTSPRERSNRILVQGTQSFSSSDNCLHGVCGQCESSQVIPIIAWERASGFPPAPPLLPIAPEGELQHLRII